MKTQTEENFNFFFIALEKMSENLEDKDLKKGSGGKNLQNHISIRHQKAFYLWILKNQEAIRKEVLNSPDLARVYEHDDTHLYLSFEIAVRDKVYLFIFTKSKLANLENDIRIKETLTPEELKSGKTKSKEIRRGLSKIVQYCFCWTETMPEPIIFTQAVVTDLKAIEGLKKEIKFGHIIGKPFANVGIFGSQRTKGDKQVGTFYSSLAPGDQMDWVEGIKMPSPNKMGPGEFILVLYAQALEIERLSKLGIIWQDLKIENFLMTFVAIKIMINDQEQKKLLLLPKMIDFSFSKLIGDSKEQLDNREGTYPYLSPWHNFYLKLRKAKMLELFTLAEINKLQKENRNLNPEEMKALNDKLKSSIVVFQQLEAAILKINPDCKEAVSVIKAVKNVNDLCNPERSQDFKFLSSPRDDAWALSKVLSQFIALVWKQYSVTGSSALGQMYQYFQKNMFASWKNIHTGPQIAGKIEQILIKNYPDSQCEFRLLMSGVKRHFSEVKEQKTPVQAPKRTLKRKQSDSVQPTNLNLSS